MQRQLKFLIILVILIVILLIGGGIIGYFYWQANKDATPMANQNVNATVNTNATTTNTQIETTENVNIETVGAGQTVSDEAFLQQLARSFTERYGSFSNQNDYENLLNLKIYMTPKMQKNVDQFIEDNKAEAGEENYYGITTKVLSTEKVSLEDNKAVYQVSAQRKESRGLQGNSKTNTEEARVEFKKVDGEWKVHNLTWR